MAVERAPRATTPYWVATTPAPSYPALRDDLTVDVAIIGGGMVGVTTAYLLAKAGKSVAMLETNRILEGVTGHTTGKLTAGHGRIYSTLEKTYDGDTARAYAASNQGAVDWVAQTIGELGIECDLARTPNYVYADRAHDRDSLREEAAAETRAGLDASFVEDVPLPFPTFGAVKVEGSIRFHPRRYLLGLVAAFLADGGQVFEDTRVTGVDEGEPCRVQTSGGVVTARDVVIATNFPFGLKGLYFAKAYPKRSYAVAGVVDPARVPEGMFISTAPNFRSLRDNPHNGGRILIVGGEPHKTGNASDTRERFGRVELWANRHFGIDDFEWRWSTHDPRPADDLPYIGRWGRTSRHAYVATGFAGWGMSKSTLAGQIISDRILGDENPYTEMYEAPRWNFKASITDLLKENAGAGGNLVAGHLTRADYGSADEIERGQAGYVRDGIRKIACYRDDDGALHAVGSTCTHLGCTVRWNAAEVSWDCPCHGSRFTPDGKVLHGPATKDLAPADLGGNAGG